MVSSNCKDRNDDQLLKRSLMTCCFSEGLRRLTAQYRERDNQLQRQGMTPSNALQFDANITLPHVPLVDEKQKTNRTKGQQQQIESAP